MELCVQNPNGMSQKFPQFNTVTDASDHHYNYCSNSANNTATNTPFYKRIMKEWRILQKNLPPAIYVRIYENKIDLLRAVIIGAAETPYHDGLFFFDFYFPVEYPNKPPWVHYKSYGLRINPNLYSSGYVCLSILNTWAGPSWQPNVSTVLQVLVSIQGLVLNEKPFYNEPMFSKGRFDKWARSYGYNAFALSCKTMIYVLSKPPKNFEELVVEHFCDRGRSILTACKAYMNGYVRVGEYQDGGLSLPDQKVKVSKTFSFLMYGQYSNLFKALAKNDWSLNDFSVQLNQLVEKIEKDYKEKTKISEKKSMSSWFSGIVKKFIGFNKCLKSNAD